MRIVVLFLLSFLFMSCADSKDIDGKTYEPYGLFNQEAKYDSSIIYQVSPGSVVCGIIFSETVVVPVYVIGWDLYEPVRKKH